MQDISACDGRGIAYDPVNKDLYVAEEGCNTFAVISGTSNQLVSGGAAWNAPIGITYDSTNGEIYVADAEYSVVTVVYGSNNTVLTRDLAVPGDWLEADAFDPANGYIYLTSAQANGVAVMSGSSNTPVGTVGVGGGQYGIAYDNATGEIYVSESSRVVVFSPSTRSVVANISGPGGGAWNQAAVSSVVYDPSNGLVYVSDPATAQVTVIAPSTNAIVSNLTVGRNPSGMAYDSRNGYLYVANFDSANLSVVDTRSNTVIGNISVGPLPVGVAFDPDNGYVYVTNASSGVQVVAPLDSNPWVTSFSSAPRPARLLPLWLNVSASGGQLPYTFAYSGLPPGCVTADTSVLECTPHRSGNYTVTVTVTDPAGRSTHASLALSVRPFEVSVNASPGVVHVGQTLYLNASVADDIPPYTFVYAGLPEGCPSSNGSNYVCQPEGSGNFSVTVTVTDSFGNSGVATVPLQVLPGPLVSILASRPGVDVNESVTFRTLVANGAAPFRFLYSPSSASAGCVPSNGTELNCTPEARLAGDSFSVTVSVIDAFGNREGSTSGPVQVYPALNVAFNASPIAPLLGQTVAFIANASGGRAPYAFGYSGFPPGCVSVNLSKIGCLPTQAGWYNVTVSVVDGNGNIVRHTVALDVYFDFDVLAPASVIVGQSLVITVDTNRSFQGAAAAAEGSVRSFEGFGTLSYSYSGLPPGCASADTSVLRCSPTQVGSYRVMVEVHDQLGNGNRHSVQVQVVPENAFASELGGAPGYYVLAAIAGTGLAIGAVVFTIHRRKDSPNSRSGEP